MTVSNMKHWLRGLIYPGLDLHTQNRAMLCRFWKNGTRDVLDAGSGNGYYSWLAYRSGARVVAINFEREQVDKARDFLVGFRKADGKCLQFEQRNLYELDQETRTFDEIICYEVLEHLKRDTMVVKEFHRILRRDGHLHIYCPYSLHPRHQVEVLAREGKGGHVRAGYVEEDYRAMLEPLGFRIDRVVGIGTPTVYFADYVVRTIRNRFGDTVALPLLPLCLPFNLVRADQSARAVFALCPGG